MDRWPTQAMLGWGKQDFSTTNLPEIPPQIAILKVRTYKKRPHPRPLFPQVAHSSVLEWGTE